MLMPCEIAVKSVIPAVRAYIATELTQTHKMKQTEAAERLGITQTAISKYISHVRGQVISIGQIEEASNLMNQIALDVAHNKISGPHIIPRLCEVCRVVRENGFMCELCKRVDPKISLETCQACRSDSFKC